MAGMAYLMPATQSRAHANTGAPPAGDIHELSRPATKTFASPGMAPPCRRPAQVSGGGGGALPSAGWVRRPPGVAGWELGELHACPGTVEVEGMGMVPMPRAVVACRTH